MDQIKWQKMMIQAFMGETVTKNTLYIRSADPKRFVDYFYDLGSLVVPKVVKVMLYMNNESQVNINSW